MLVVRGVLYSGWPLQVDKLGGGFLAYLLLMEMGALSGSTLHLYAEAIHELHNEVHNGFSMNRRVSYLRSLNILHHGIEILSSHFAQTTALGLRGVDRGDNDDDDGEMFAPGEDIASHRRHHHGAAATTAAAAASPSGRRGHLGAGGHASSGSAGSQGAGGRASLADKFITGSLCLTAKHMPYFRDVEVRPEAPQACVNRRSATQL